MLRSDRADPDKPSKDAAARAHHANKNAGKRRHIAAFAGWHIEKKRLPDEMHEVIARIDPQT